jgi:3-methyladenine DNA glycosylase AlkD
LQSDRQRLVRLAARIVSDLNDTAAATTPAVRAVRRRYSRMLALEPPRSIFTVANALLATGNWRERVVAFELVAGHPGAMARITPATIDRWSSDLSDWGSVDLFGVTVAGQAWRGGRITDGHVRRWARSRNRWRRRLALVSTVPLNSRARGGGGDPARTLTVCSMLVEDRDEMVVKALSWALRELAKRDPTAVAGFLDEQQARLAPRVRREVRTKLDTGRKAPPATRTGPPARRRRHD